MERQPTLIVDETQAEAAIARCPSMLKGPGPLVPQLSMASNSLYTIVFDLDETLIHGRQGTVKVRPGVHELLQALDNTHKCEVVVWTAGERDYAQRIVSEIDPNRVIQHCIYRHQRWFKTRGYTKKLTMLGRPMDRVLIVENTPDCVRCNPNNAIIVEDFLGHAKDKSDATLNRVADLVVEMCNSDLPVSEFITSCPKLVDRVIEGEEGPIKAYFMLASPAQHQDHKAVPSKGKKAQEKQAKLKNSTDPIPAEEEDPGERLRNRPRRAAAMKAQETAEKRAPKRAHTGPTSRSKRSRL
eukprot:TRINITY_DN43682_c0_g1_i1.p1 TRINITY_DN43682_c0_g1~~TRINITY_DN43682_c0_g1_i1.p1  ORF type:complete len:308 (+),score=41.98 TRINITY_DN43682_c0_g1_i1:31-924(+)